MLPSLHDVEEISTYILHHPIGRLEDAEIIAELGHWNTLCRTRLWEECRRAAKKDNPISRVNVIRLGSLIIELISIPMHVVFPPIGLALTLGGLGMGVHNEIVEFGERRRRKIAARPVDPIHQRCVALEKELAKRSNFRAS